MDWSDIAIPGGSPQTGELTLETTLAVPDPTSQRQATDRQVDAVNFFYNRKWPNLTEDQAHALLSCRDFALRTSETTNKDLHPNIQHFLARGIAAFILADPRSLEFAVRWSDRVFEQGSSSPRVKGTPIYPEIQAFNDYMLGMLEMEGWSLELLR